MLKGFRDFLLRGNVIDLAVAVVIGAAFTAIVTAFTSNIIQPLINAIGSTDVGLGFHIRSGDDATFVDLGSLITAAINFIIIAAVVYFVIVLPSQKLMARFGKPKEEESGEPTEQQLLTEIRDLLASQKPGGTRPSAGGSHVA